MNVLTVSNYAGGMGHIDHRWQAVFPGYYCTVTKHPSLFQQIFGLFPPKHALHIIERKIEKKFPSPTPPPCLQQALPYQFDPHITGALRSFA